MTRTLPMPSDLQNSPASPKVSVVIVSWNTRHLLSTTLTTLYAQTRGLTFEVFVVDNGSSDGTPEFVRRNWPAVRLIVSLVNVGFAAGNNLALRHCRGEFILLLNSDVIVLPTTVSGLAAFLDSSLATGCVGARHLNADMTLQRSIGHYPSLLEDFLAYTELHRLKSLQSFLSRRFAYWGPHDIVREVDWVNGACIMVRRSVLDQAGLLDEGFFIYAEELDWCYRIRRAGWLIHYTPDAEVVHLGGQAMDQVPARRIELKLTSQYRFYIKHHAAWRCFVWRLIVFGVAVSRLALLSFLLPLRSFNRLQRGRLDKFWQLAARERASTAPRAVLCAWWRILVFAVLGGPKAP